MDLGAGFEELDLFTASLGVDTCAAEFWISDEQRARNVDLPNFFSARSSRYAFDGTDKNHEKVSKYGLGDHSSSSSYLVASWITCLLDILFHEVLQFDILESFLGQKIKSILP